MRRLIAACLLALTLLPAACSRQPRLVVYAPAGAVDAALAEEWERATQWGLELVEFEQAEPEMLLTGEPACDVLLLPGHLVPELTAADRLRPLDVSRLPHAADLALRFRAEPSDGANEHSIPVAFRLAGVAHQGAEPQVADWGEWLPEGAGVRAGAATLEPDPDLVVGVALIAAGRAPTTTDIEDYQAAADRLRGLTPRIAGFDPSALAEVDAAAFTICWSNVKPAGAEFSIPTDGTLLSTIRAAVPATSVQADQAQAFIEFLLEPERNGSWSARRGFGGTTGQGAPALHAALRDHRAVWRMVRIERALPLRDRLWAALRGNQ